MSLAEEPEKPKQQCRAGPSLEASLHGRLRPLALGSMGGVEGVSGAKQEIAVLDMPHRRLKTAFLGLQGGRRYRRLQASRPGCEAGAQHFAGRGGGGVQRPWYGGIWG